MLEKLVRDKHPSLLPKVVNCGLKSFTTLATAWFAAITLMLDEGAMIGLYRMTTGNTEERIES
jgi:hypothetical protein